MIKTFLTLPFPNSSEIIFQLRFLKIFLKHYNATKFALSLSLPWKNSSFSKPPILLNRKDFLFYMTSWLKKSPLNQRLWLISLRKKRKSFSVNVCRLDYDWKTTITWFKLSTFIYADGCSRINTAYWAVYSTTTKKYFFVIYLYHMNRFDTRLLSITSLGQLIQ